MMIVVVFFVDKVFIVKLFNNNYYLEFKCSILRFYDFIMLMLCKRYVNLLSSVNTSSTDVNDSSV